MPTTLLKHKLSDRPTRTIQATIENEIDTWAKIHFIPIARGCIQRYFDFLELRHHEVRSDNFTMFLARNEKIGPYVLATQVSISNVARIVYNSVHCAFNEIRVQSNQV